MTANDVEAVRFLAMLGLGTNVLGLLCLVALVAAWVKDAEKPWRGR